ncbi:MAG TPA: DUF721 domain-containing protein [Candidatus Hydrogenedentes bacterium]|nr:DUF721 domain-containing protein [Candidatus Hydrogenedentota bacterium]HOK90392.1 DUF721 domain-containing protein [Candidatus Hydrogenedentota bacterium]
MSEPESIRSILHRMIHTTELGATLEKARIWGQWARIAGEDLAACTAPAALENGLLVVHVADTSWMDLCLYEKWEMVRRINREAGRLVVSDIRFELAPEGVELGHAARKLRKRSPGSRYRGKKKE